MALFRKKSSSEDGTKNSKGDNGAEAFTPQPDKARKWFEHAKAAADSSNFDYALQCFAGGIKFDPGSMTAHERMWDSAVRYMQQGAKPASSRETKSIDDGSPVGKFAAAEFEWMKDLRNAKAGVKALEAAIAAEQLEVGNWFAPKVLNLVRQQKKINKSMLLQAMELFRQVGAWDESLAIGEMARQLDPTDSDLDAELKNLSAQRAMDQGGYTEAVGSEGGFRKFIKDEDKQRELIEEESLAGAGSAADRVFARAKAAYEGAPTAADSINQYAQLLKKQGTRESIEQAMAVYQKGFEDTGEYRFRMRAGDIQIELADSDLRALTEQLHGAPDDAALKERHDVLRTELLQLKLAEYTERVAKYPTDRLRKYDLGTVQYALGEYEEAMAQFQKSKDEPKLRVRAGQMLGRCFFAEQWYSEATTEFQEALHAADGTDQDRELSIKYDLMLALLENARAESSADLAKEAKTICSDIARTDITYRDIRAKRKEVDQVIQGLTGGRD